MPYRLSIVGPHGLEQSPGPSPGYGPWELSADRANAVRQILEAEGVPPGNIFMVAGKADTEPLVPGRSLHGRQPPGDHHADARRAAAARRILTPVEGGSSGSAKALCSYRWRDDISPAFSTPAGQFLNE